MTIALFTANVGMFAWMWAHGVDPSNPTVEDLGRFGANQGYAVAHGDWYRLATCMFVHGGIVHLLVNMYSLYVLGPFAEMLYGHVTYLLVYLIAGVGGSIASSLWHPLVVSVGASGAIFGVLGAVIAFFLTHRREMPSEVFKGFMKNVLVVIAINVFIGLSVQQIDNSAHVGGALTGIACGLAASRPARTPRVLTGKIVLRLAAVAAVLAGMVFLVPGRVSVALRDINRSPGEDVRPR